MRIMNKKLAVLICTALMSTVAIAEDGIESSVELGLIQTTGNTETQSINAKANVMMTKGKWGTSASLEALNVSGDEGRLSEKYIGTGQVAYLATDRSYGFLMAKGEHDPFSGYSYQVTSALGYGYRAIKKDDMVLDLEAGPGFRQLKVRDTGDKEDEALLHLRAYFALDLSKTSKLTEDLVIDAGEDSTIIRSVTAVTAQIVGNLAMKASFTLKNTSDVPPGVEDTDTETSLALVYSF